MGKRKNKAKKHSSIKYETKDAALAAVREQAKNLEFCSEEMKNDYDVVMSAVLAWPKAIQYASPEMRENSEIAMAVVKKDADALRFIRIDEMEKEGALAVSKMAVTKSPNSIIHAGKYKSFPEVALIAIKKHPSISMINSVDPKLSLNLDFLEGVGKISKTYNDEELISHTLCKGIREANGDLGHLNNLCYAAGHFEYNKIISGNEYNFLRQELSNAQEGLSGIVVPFRLGEFDYKDDHHWDGMKEAVHIAEERRFKEYKDTFTMIYADYSNQGIPSKEAAQKALIKLKTEYFPEDSEVETWYYENMAVSDIRKKEKEPKEINKEKDEDNPFLREEPVGQPPIPDLPPETTYYEEEYDDEYSSLADYGFEDNVVNLENDQKDGNIQEKNTNQDTIERKVNINSLEKEERALFENENIRVYRTPSAEEWEKDDVKTTPEDFAWWEQYRKEDGTVDFSRVPSIEEIPFVKVKALIEKEPEYIMQLPEVPYRQHGKVGKERCYGRNDERLFRAIIKSHYGWVVERDSIVSKIKGLKRRMTEINDPNILKDMNKEIEIKQKELEEKFKQKPENFERDTLLIRYAGIGLRERTTTDREGGLNSITRKFVVTNPKAFEYVSSRARTDPAIAVDAVRAEPTMLQFADSKTVNDPDIIFDIYKENPDAALQYAGRTFFLTHKNFVAGMIRENPDVVAKFASGRLLDDKEFARFAVRQNGMCLHHFNSNIQHDREIVEIAIKNSGGKCLSRAKNVHVNDPSLAKKIVSIFPASLNFFKYTIKGMYDVVKYAVTKDPSSIRYASKEIRGDKNMALSLVKEDGMVLGDLSTDRRADYDVVLEATRQNGLALQFATLDLKNNLEIVFSAVGEDGFALQFAGEKARNVPLVALTALKQNIDSLGFVGKGLINDEYFLKKATEVINKVEEQEYAKKGETFVPYTQDEIKGVIEEGKALEDRTTFMSRMEEGISEVFIKPASERFPVINDILKKAGHKPHASKSKIMTFDVDAAIKRGREKVKRKEEEKLKKENNPSKLTKDDGSKTSKKLDKEIDK